MSGVWQIDIGPATQDSLRGQTAQFTMTEPTAERLDEINEYMNKNVMINYLKDGKPHSIEGAIQSIEKSGGIAVLQIKLRLSTTVTPL